MKYDPKDPRKFIQHMAKLEAEQAEKAEVNKPKTEKPKTGK